MIQNNRRDCVHPSVKESKEEKSNTSSGYSASGSGPPGLEYEVVPTDEMEEGCHHDHHGIIAGR
jgi:hypothetical protein